MDRTALADFLRRRRDALRPADVGLPPGARRRAVGLRREEVAHLTGMSVDYYVRLEQARSPQPSPQLLRPLARTLRLSDDERDHLFRLAGHEAPTRTGTTAQVRPGLLHLLDRLDDCIAFVVSDTDVMLAQNRFAAHVMGPLPTGSGPEASATWQWFTDPAARLRYPPEDHPQHSRVRVADLRATWSRRKGAADVQAIVDGLTARSPEFRALWAQHEVQIRRQDQKRIVLPQVGLVAADCEIMLTPDENQRLVLLTAPPGSPDHQKLRLAAVLGAPSTEPPS
jgi:transcriptional regulator with XRE-family HTH domain